MLRSQSIMNMNYTYSSYRKINPCKVYISLVISDYTIVIPPNYSILEIMICYCCSIMSDLRENQG